MKSIISKTVAAGMIMTGVVFADELVVEEIVVSEVPETEVSVTFDFASAYIFRGTTLNDDAVFQPGIEASGLGMKEAWGSLVIGAWGNFDFNGYEGGEDSEFSEVDWYASYSLPTRVDGLDIFVGWCEYTYPSGGGDADKEANVGIGYDLFGVALGATANFMVGGDYNGQNYYNLSAGYGYALTDELELGAGATAGYLEQGDDIDGEDGWNEGTLDIGASYAVCDGWSVGASYSYIYQLDDDVLVDGKGAYDLDSVFMFSVAGSF
jgi:uncharacterized protein (TIGR02001 family)